VPKSKEEMLREEVRFYVDIMQRMMQWGLTLLVSLQTALFFLRRQMIETYVDAGIIHKGDNLPWGRYLIGSTFLLIAATVLWIFGRRATQQYRLYKNQLVEANESGIKDQPTKGTSRWSTALYFAFPLFDVAIRLYVSIQVSLR
jgi:hypothetical protein